MLNHLGGNLYCRILLLLKHFWCVKYIYLPPQFTDVECQGAPTLSSDTNLRRRHPLWLITNSTHALLHWSSLCNRWRLKAGLHTEMNRQKTKACQNSEARSDGSLPLYRICLRTFHFRLTSCHCCLIPIATPLLISSLMNHFTSSWNVIHGEQRQLTSRIINPLIFAFTTNR